MDRHLSAPSTLFQKIIFPPVFLTIAAVIALQSDQLREQFSYSRGQFSLHFPLWYIFAAPWLLVAIYLAVLSKRLKYVELDGDYLLVSNYWRDWRVPLSSVASVTTQYAGRGSTFIRLVFKENYGFGRTLIFPPKVDWITPMASTDRLAAELRELAGLPVLQS